MTSSGFLLGSSRPLNVRLVRDRLRSLKRGHPWLLSGYVEGDKGAPSGSLALLRDRDGKVIAQGIYDPRSVLCFRAVALNPERLDDALVAGRLERALAHRRSLFGAETTGFRLLNGEGDGLPGLVCDIYGDLAVFLLDGAGPAGFWRLSAFGEWLESNAGIGNAYRKRRSGEKEGSAAVVRGEGPAEPRRFIENGLHFEADVVHGQKTGFFFDQRDNRARIRGLAAGKRVLNLFSYTGGFSIYAGAGGAASVTSVDLARPAIEAAKRNWSLNGLPADRHEALAADAMDFLVEAASVGRRWDIVIVDPPSYAPAKEHLEAAKAGYRKVIAAAAAVTEKGGILAASSCSSHVSPEMFLELCEEAVSAAKRRATVLGIYGQPEDHPFPLACPELRYLKFDLLRLD